MVFNPAPLTPAVLDYPLDRVRLLIVNESEGQGLSGHATPEAILNNCGPAIRQRTWCSRSAPRA